MYNRLLLYNLGIMICLSNLDGVTVGEALVKFSVDCFKENLPPKQETETLLKVVTKSCTALGHITVGACGTRKFLLAKMDHFSLNSIFTISPCNLRSFRIQLFEKADEWVNFLDLQTIYFIEIFLNQKLFSYF